MARRTHAAREARMTSKTALGRYLAAGLGATGLATVECEAAIVSIDIFNTGIPSQNISGVGAGINPNSSGNSPLAVQNSPFYGASFILSNFIGTGPYAARYQGFSGNFSGQDTVQFAAGTAFQSFPLKFTSGSIGSTLPFGQQWTSSPNRVQFARAYAPYFILSEAPDWGGGSYIGFRARPNDADPNWNYGYFEVTWNATSEQFQILSGAYESTVNTPIAVPEPSTVALTGIGALALGAGAIRRSRKARKAAADGTLAEAV